MKIITFFNNKGGVGKTSLVYHLAWMFNDLGVKTIAADLDPQANLTVSFLNDTRLEEVWENEPSLTLVSALKPIIKGTGDIADVHIEAISDNLDIIIGDLLLSAYEDRLSTAWSECFRGGEYESAFRITSSIYRVLKRAAEVKNAEIILMDVGPNLGAINRAAVLGADYIIVPLAPDLYSLRGLSNLGLTLKKWKDEWQEILKKRPNDNNLVLPDGSVSAAGYVVLQHAVRLDRPVKACDRWMQKIPNAYKTDLLYETNATADLPGTDSNQIAVIKHYRSLMPMAHEAGKPIFHLKPADGALGGHMEAVRECEKDFRTLAIEVAKRCNVNIDIPAV